MFRVIVPLIDYTLNFNFIVSELCEQRDVVENTCMGKCHLSKELKKQVDFPEGNKVLIKVDFLKIPHTFELISNLLLTECSDILITCFTEKEILLALEPNLPPPKILVI